MYGSPNVTKIWNTNYFLGEGLLIILTSFFLLDFDNNVTGGVSPDNGEHRKSNKELHLDGKG